MASYPGEISREKDKLWKAMANILQKTFRESCKVVIYNYLIYILTNWQAITKRRRETVRWIFMFTRGTLIRRNLVINSILSRQSF